MLNKILSQQYSPLIPKKPSFGTILEQQITEEHALATVGFGRIRDLKDNILLGGAIDTLLKRYIAPKWNKTAKAIHNQKLKKVYYLSLEILLGRLLGDALRTAGLWNQFSDAMKAVGKNPLQIEELELDAGLGNGGLGRLAACYADSAAQLDLPFVGYGLLYQYGLFKQELKNGIQTEALDEWMSNGYRWAMDRSGILNPKRVIFGGQLYRLPGATKREPTQYIKGSYTFVEAIPFDLPIPGPNIVNMWRFWSTQKPLKKEVDFKLFNEGKFNEAFKVKGLDPEAEKLTAQLYPNDKEKPGQELRLKQQALLVSATLQDIIESFEATHNSFDEFPEKVAIQINDTHPALGIPELMRILIDEKELTWDKAWDITTKTFNYTNHTILQEALEEWPADMMAGLLPRHYEIIEEINSDFMNEVQKKYPDNSKLYKSLSIIEGGENKVRMAHLAFIGSNKVNGVAALHTEILKNDVFKSLHHMYPNKLTNKTNGITPRRWLLGANPTLAKVITQKIGSGWQKDLYELQKLKKFSDDPSFHQELAQIKKLNKQKIAKQFELNPNSLFDIQAKRIHLYKRQLLNFLNILYQYNEIKKNPDSPVVPRSYIFAGKAAASYFDAKAVIYGINILGKIIENDPHTKNLLKVSFLPNYSVSLAEKIIPAADLSEQISLAGKEASGTGNMKFSLNGALTIGTMDGANVEMAEEFGEENMYIFGMTAQEAARKKSTYNPMNILETNQTLFYLTTLLKSGDLGKNQSENDTLKHIGKLLTEYGDEYMVLQDFTSYLEAQQKVSEDFQNPAIWHKKVIMNIAGMGKFSSDRAIADYNRDIWHLEPVILTN